MFNKQLPLRAKVLLQYQASLLREQSPLQKPTDSRVREEKVEDTSTKNTGSKKAGLIFQLREINGPLYWRQTVLKCLSCGKRILCNDIKFLDYQNVLRALEDQEKTLTEAA